MNCDDISRLKKKKKKIFRLPLSEIMEIKTREYVSDVTVTRIYIYYK